MGDKHFLQDTSTIITGCKKGSEKCQEVLYKNYYGYVMSIVLRYVIRRDLAEEALNDCFLKVFNNIKNYDEMKPFKTWLRQIAINTCIDLLRKENKIIHVSDSQFYDVPFNENITDTINYKSIISGLTKLPILHRLVFNMYVIEGYSHNEISKKLGIKESSSRTFLTRAKTKLKDYYQYINKVKNVGI